MRNSIRNMIGLASLLAMVGCGSADLPSSESAQVGSDSTSEQNQAIEKSFEQRAQDWASFVQTRPLEDERLQAFTELNQGGCCGFSGDFSAYLNRLQAEDLSFSRSIDQLKLANEEVLHSFECLRSGVSEIRACEIDQTLSSTELHTLALVDNYRRLREVGDVARLRIIETAAILDWSVVPANALPDSVAMDFVSTVNQAIRTAVAGNPNAFAGQSIPQIDASALQAVSIQLDDIGSQSFFQFTPLVSFIGSPRGALTLVPIADNDLVPSVLTIP